METFIVFVNDAEFAKRQLIAFIEGHKAARWVLVGCPPRLPRHSGRFRRSLRSSAGAPTGRTTPFRTSSRC